MWVKYSDDVSTPKQILVHLSKNCMFCNSEMEHYFNDDFRCTNRRCSNPNCKSYVAAKMDVMLKILGIKGIGFKTAIKIIDENGYTRHWQLLQYLDLMPEIELFTFMRIVNIDGIDSGWEKELVTNHIFTLEDLATKYTGKYKEIVDAHKDDILDAAKYFLIKTPEFVDKTSDKTVYLNIMITGVPNGFQSKEAFIDYCNKACGGYIVITHQKTKRQSGVHYLIREPGSTTRGKVEAAEKGGIPIVTSKQFFASLAAILRSLD